ncbi:MAG: TatD family hydrolase [Solirubrobacterales bacterium]
MIDSHTHLELCEGEAAELVSEARDAGVSRILTVGIDEESSRRALELARENDGVRAAVGRHPNSATGFDEAAEAKLLELAADPACAAVGETGIDLYRDAAPPADQERAFAAQARIAREVGKPLVIHTRAAEEQTIAFLREHAKGLAVILHCFSMADRLDECLAEGWWISFAGNVTYPSAADLAAAASRVPADRLLVETDAPYLAPQPHRGERNCPAYVVETARFLAELRGVPYEELEASVEANAQELFGW